jgi:hypothetical protein
MPEILDRIKPRIEEARARVEKRVLEVRERVGAEIGAPRGSPPRILEGLKREWAERPILKRFEERRKALIAGEPILGRILKERRLMPPAPTERYVTKAWVPPAEEKPISPPAVEKDFVIRV